jgi:hypothetical protein
VEPVRSPCGQVLRAAAFARSACSGAWRAVMGLWFVYQDDSMAGNSMPFPVSLVVRETEFRDYRCAVIRCRAGDRVEVDMGMRPIQFPNQGLQRKAGIRSS